MDVVRGLEVHAVVDFTGHGAIEVFLHVAVGDRWPVGQAQRDRAGLVGEFLRRAYPIGQAQAQCFVRTDTIGEEVEFARLGRSHQLREEVGAAIVTGKSHPCEGGGEDGVAGHDAHVAGQGQRQAGAGRRTGQGGQCRLGHLEKLAGGSTLVDALAMDRAIDGIAAHRAVAAGSHAFHVTARAEAAAGTGEHDAFHGRIEFGRGQLFSQRGDHRARHRVACLGAVHGQCQYAGVQVGLQVGRTGFDVCDFHGSSGFRYCGLGLEFYPASSSYVPASALRLLREPWCSGNNTWVNRCQANCNV